MCVGVYGGGLNTQALMLMDLKGRAEMDIWMAFSYIRIILKVKSQYWYKKLCIDLPSLGISVIYSVSWECGHFRMKAHVLIASKQWGQRYKVGPLLFSQPLDLKEPRIRPSGKPKWNTALELGRKRLILFQCSCFIIFFLYF